jgi:DNA polymerase-3 subunit gamma/tau
MKWAPNKKMHLEVGVIRAIQTLSQATLSEVLDALTAMRTGGPIPGSAARPPPERASAPGAARSAVPPDRPEPPPAKPVAAMVATQAAAPRAETVLSPSPLPAEEKQASSTDAADSATHFSEPPSEAALERVTSAELDPTALWHAVTARIRKERPLLTSSVEAATLLEMAGGTAVIAFPPENGLALDLLESPNNRKFTEALLGELAGRAVTIKCVKREGLVVRPAPREPEPRPVAPSDSVDEFKNDPLIRRALELFRAEIQSV